MKTVLSSDENHWYKIEVLDSTIYHYHKASRMKTVFSSHEWKHSFHLMRNTAKSLSPSIRMKTVFSSDVWKQCFHLMRTTATNASRMKTPFSSHVWKHSFHLMRTTVKNRRAHLYYLSLHLYSKHFKTYILSLSQSIKDENSIYIRCMKTVFSPNENHWYK